MFKVTIKTTERRQWHHSRVFTDTFELISHLFSSVSFHNFAKVNVSWEVISQNFVLPIFITRNNLNIDHTIFVVNGKNLMEKATVHISLFSDNRNIRKMCKLCSKSTFITLKQCQLLKVNNKDTRATPLTFWCLYC